MILSIAIKFFSSVNDSLKFPFSAPLAMNPILLIESRAAFRLFSIFEASRSVAVEDARCEINS
jgi:hypothetical protein